MPMQDTTVPYTQQHGARLHAWLTGRGATVFAIGTDRTETHLIVTADRDVSADLAAYVDTAEPAAVTLDDVIDALASNTPQARAALAAKRDANRNWHAGQ